MTNLPMPPGLDLRPSAPLLCPHCSRPMPASLVDAAFFVCGDHTLRADQREFAANLRQLLMLGCELGPAHHTRLRDLYVERHRAMTALWSERRARLEAADAT